MFKNYLLVTLLLLSIISTGRACDGCGSSMSQIYWGLTPNHGSHYVGIWWQHQYYLSGLGYSESNDPIPEYFNSIELRGRINLSSRFQLLTILPYAYHHRQFAEGRTTINGIGDIITMGSYTLFNNQDSIRRSLRHRLSIATGLKMPSGSYQPSGQSDQLNPNFQVGTGSWDLLFNISYTARFDRYGLQMDATYQRTTTNRYDYRFGDRFSGFLSFFYLGAYKKLEFMPSIGLLAEHAAWDVQENYYRTNTGGHALSGSINLEVYTTRVNWGINFAVPITQDLNGGSTEIQTRFSTHVNYFF